jgi:hypothetical protein
MLTKQTTSGEIINEVEPCYKFSPCRPAFVGLRYDVLEQSTWRALTANAPVSRTADLSEFLKNQYFYGTLCNAMRRDCACVVSKMLHG